MIMICRHVHGLLSPAPVGAKERLFPEPLRGRHFLEENAWEVKELCNLQHFGAVLVPPILRHLAPTNARRVEPRMSAFAEM